MLLKKSAFSPKHTCQQAVSQYRSLCVLSLLLNLREFQTDVFLEDFGSSDEIFEDHAIYYNRHLFRRLLY